ncbi:hypothetical protein HJA87_29560 [Rhizobium bangladeshense]|uniref:Uncharacterized protein n=1 Tax=Rhizobium bangladeshense TaxID=1138189 RepID=A0ABS7LRI0_9HYPH|nr:MULTISPECIES: hypothetical protein [Rhizobium]MBY3593989.1 hypothetical protein [Rhizobium bangladeshense]MBY3600011.1 hypothetical protein [Rhizobium bangladeshense]
MAARLVVLIVGTHSAAEQKAIRRHLQRKRSVDDDFVIRTVFVRSVEDALHETRVNTEIQAVVIRNGLPLRSQDRHLATSHWGLEGLGADIEAVPESERGPTLGRLIAEFRPELDLYLFTDGNVEEIAARTGETFTRIFFREEDCDELYSSIIRNVVQRYDAPFFFALRDHAKLPVSNFHALPVSRGKSIRNSKWIGACATI